jgi:cytochrome c biogenesis protein
MGGGTLSAAGSFRGSVTVPQGLNFVVGDVLGPTGFLSIPTDAFNTEIHVNRFSMDYFESGEVNAYFSLYEIGVMILAIKFMNFQPE